MSGLSVLGGVGQGLMQGSQFVQQKRQQDARLGMLEEQQGWQRDDRQTQQAEQRRMAEMNEIYMQTVQEMGPDADPLTLDTEVFKRSVASGRATKAELEPLLAGVRQLRQRGITNAIRMGDQEKLGGLLSEHYGRPVQMRVSQAQDEYGQMSPLYSIVGQDGAEVARFSTPQLASILGADDLLAEEERRLDMRKTHVETDRARASAEASRASASNSYASAGKTQGDARHQAELRLGQRILAEGREPTDDREARAIATAKAELASKGSSTGTPSTMEKEARFMVEIGAAPDLQTATQLIRADGNLRHVLGLMSQDIQSITNPEEAYKRAQKLVNQPVGVMFPHVESHGSDAQGHPATDDSLDIDLRRFLTQGGR